MKGLLLFLLVLPKLTVSACAMEITAPEVPSAALDVMPDNTDSFGTAVLELIQNVIAILRPDFVAACRTSLIVITAVILISLIIPLSGKVKKTVLLAGTGWISSILLSDTYAMVRLASDTISELSAYGKLLIPVMTAAMSAQGGIRKSASLYTGTVAFDMLLSSLISEILIPMVYIFLALAIGNCASGEDALKKLRDFLKALVSWGLKTLLTVFTTYLSISGVVSGTTDAAALKATRVSISSFVPVVGGILSDASEAVLVSAGLMKNAAGIYGIIAILALFLEPFLKIGIQYLIIKVTAGLCGILGSKEICSLIDDFSTAMGFLLAMTGSMCLLLLISTVCFLKGVG